VATGTPEDVVGSARRWKRLAKAKRAGLMRCHTGEVLSPVLAAGPLVRRKPHDFAAEAARREGDLEIVDVGQEAKMPWEVNGRRWHTKDRLGRTGNPCRWDGRILAEVIDRIQRPGPFSPTDWNSRSVVEIRAARKSDGWFFHAITGEEWLLKMKFRTAKNTFRREELVSRLDLKPLNDMPDLPLYGTEPRVRCKMLRGPWQEIELRVCGYEEIDRPEFWQFLEEAVAGFRKFAERPERKPEDLMPWKVLGRRWHFLPKGFPVGKRARWETSLLDRLCRMLSDTAPGAQFVWSNKQVVHLLLPQQNDPWASIQTKKVDAVYLMLRGPKNRFALGQVAGLGHDPDLSVAEDCDVLRVKFRRGEDLDRGDLAAFLKEHVEAVGNRA